MDAIDWLLDSDPAIRWQAMRDLTNVSPAAIAAERGRVALDGLGRKILERQEPDGAWRRADAPAWLPTLFTFLLLRATGVDRTDPAVQAAVARIEMCLRWGDDDGRWELRRIERGGNAQSVSGAGYFGGEVEPCINGGVLALGAYFGRPMEGLARRLVGEQLQDGGWNCDAPKSSRSSFHTTICVLEGLLEYERAHPARYESDSFLASLRAARKRGEEYLLKRRLFRRLSTGEVANPEFLELAFPPRYHFDILRGLDYFRSARMHDKLQPDAELSDAVRLLLGKRQADGRWLLDRSYDEALGLSIGESVGEPSRWNTLRALRVLRWFEFREPS